MFKCFSEGSSELTSLIEELLYSVFRTTVILCITSIVTLPVPVDSQCGYCNVVPLVVVWWQEKLTNTLKYNIPECDKQKWVMPWEAELGPVMIPFTFWCCGGCGCPSDIVLRCHAMVTTVELQRRCIHCRHFTAVNHSSVFRRSYRLLNLPHWMSAGHWGLISDHRFPFQIPDGIFLIQINNWAGEYDHIWHPSCTNSFLLLLFPFVNHTG